MTERKRLRRARMLLAHVAEGCSPAAAWRKANPRNKASSDKSAADMFRREMRWIARRWMEDHPDAPALASDWWQKPKRCVGVDDRPCGKEIPRRRKRCTACATAQDRLNQRGYRRTYSLSYREPANAKRNERRGKQHQSERIEEKIEKEAAAKRAEEARRAKLPRVVEHNGETYLYDPKTDEWEIRSHRDKTFVPLPPGHPVPPVPAGDWRQRQREASQPGRAPRADRQSSKQQTPPASAGKKRQAEANRASPKCRCKTCAHPDRDAIDAELLQNVSLRTVGGRYGISSSALDRHRSSHLKALTVGDILEPVDRDDEWQEWDGAKLQRIIPAPRREHLRLVKGRPDDIPQRSDYSVDRNCPVTRRVFRRRGSR